MLSQCGNKKKRKERKTIKENSGISKAIGFASEFKAMISKGNVVDMAVGVIIGGAIGKIVTSLVNDIIMPCISAVTGGGGYASWKIVLKEAVLDSAGEVVTAENAIMVGSFISTVVDFLIIALCIFFMIKAIGGAKAKLERKKEEVPAEPKPEEPAPETELDVLKEIRALLSDKGSADK